MNVVYLDGGDISQGFSALGDLGGVIVICGKVSVTHNFEYNITFEKAFCEPKHRGEIFITSVYNGTDYTKKAMLVFDDKLLYRLSGDLRFSNIVFYGEGTGNACFAANYNTLIFGNGCVMKNPNFTFSVVGGYKRFRYIDAPSLPYDDYRIRVINRANRVPNSETFTPDNLKKVGNTDFLMDAEAADNLYSLLTDMEKEGLNNREIIETLRTHERQKYLLEFFTKKNMEKYNLDYEAGKKRAALSCGFADASEHRIGLAADIYSRKISHPKFDTLPEFEWMIKNGEKYGIILRFCKGFGDVTGCVYEAWHFRYVGAEHAAEINRKGYCLEEYAAEKYGYFSKDSNVIIKSGSFSEIFAGSTGSPYINFTGKNHLHIGE